MEKQTEICFYSSYLFPRRYSNNYTNFFSSAIVIVVVVAVATAIAAIAAGYYYYYYRHDSWCLLLYSCGNSLISLILKATHPKRIYAYQKCVQTNNQNQNDQKERNFKENKQQQQQIDVLLNLNVGLLFQQLNKTNRQT